jgi:predicted Holliday junction resolvase-like endonuclease
MNELRDIFLRTRPLDDAELRDVELNSFTRDELFQQLGESQGRTKILESEVEKLKSFERDATAYRALVRYRDDQVEHLRDVINGKTAEEIVAPILEDYEGESDDFVPGEFVVGLYKAKLVNRYYYMEALTGDELRDAEQAEADRREKDQQDGIEQEAEHQRELGEGR